MKQEAKKKSIFDNPALSTKAKSANVKLFPEGALGYLLGPVLVLFSNSILNTYLNKYFTDVLQLTTWAKLFSILLPIISVVFIILGNILVGKLMDHSKVKAGKARPLLLLGFPLVILAIVAIFFTPNAIKSTTEVNQSIGVLIWVAIAYNLYYAIAYPFYYTSHASLVSLSTRNSKSRSLLATMSNAAQLGAIGLTQMVLPFFIKMGFLFVDSGTTTESGAVIYDIQASYHQWQIFTIVLIICAGLGLLLEYYFTRERITEEKFASLASRPNEAFTPKKTVSSKQQFKACSTDKYWWFILIFFFLYQLGGMLKNNSQIYYCQSNFLGTDGHYTIGDGSAYSGTIAIVGAIPTALGMLAVWPLANKFGKAKTIMGGAVLAVLGGVLGLFANGNFYIAVVAFVIKALGGAPAMYIGLALLADVLDHNEAINGFRSDGLTMSIYGAIMIGMPGIANGVINAFLSAFDYSTSNIASEQIRTAMSWVFFGGETFAYLIIGIMFLFMNVEKFSKLDNNAILADQKAEAEKEGIPYIDHNVRLMQEQKEAEEISEKARVEELKAKCEKKHLNFDEEEKKYQEAKKAKDEASAKKKAANQAKKDGKAKANKLKQEQRLASMTEAQKQEEAKKAELKLEKQKKEEEELEKRFLVMREKAKSRFASVK